MADLPNIGLELATPPRQSTSADAPEFGTTFDPAPDGRHFLVKLANGPPQRVIAGITDWFSELRQKALVG